MWQLVTLAALLALMLGFDGLSDDVSRIQTGLDPKSLAATGFIILAAFTVGELSRRVRLPALIGYLGAGLAFGPSFAELMGLTDFGQLFSRRVIEDLKLVNVLAVGVVGTMGGCEIHFNELRRSWRTILLIFALIALMVLPSSTLVMIGFSQLAPGLVPFFNELPMAQIVMGSVLVGVMAMGMSPAATIALLQETGGKGPFSSLVLGIVVVADMVLVALFLVALALTKLTLAPEGLSTEGVLDAIPHIAAEFGWAGVLGVATGLLFILYLRFVKREVMLFSLGLIFAATYAAQILHAETLLVFLAAGFIVQNFSRYGHDLLHAFEQISLPVFVVYFTTQAANLDLGAMTAYLPVALVLVLVRVATLTASVRWGARMAGTGERTQRHLWLCFFSQGGVDLVLAGMVAAAIPGWGPAIQTLITSTVIIYLFLGPPLFKLAIERMGESTSARERGLENLTAETAQTPGAAAPDRLPEPEIADAALSGRLWALRGELEALDLALVRGRIGQRAALLEESLGAVEAASAAMLAALAAAEAAEAAETRRELIFDARDAFTGAICATAPTWAQIEPGLVTVGDLQELMQALEGMEGFATEFDVVREERLFVHSFGDRRSLRLVKRGRQLRRRLFGPGERTIPLGRLWRYYVAMGVPIDLWRRSEVTASELWGGLGAHVRALTELAAALADGEPEARARAEAERAASGARLTELRAQFAKIADELGGGLSRSLASAFGEVLAAVAVAGTIELPAYRYRLSRRFDAALAAKSELLSRRDREAVVARGGRDYLLAWASARAFEGATVALFHELGSELRSRLLAPTFAGIERLRAVALAEPTTSVPVHLARVLRPALALASSGVARSEALLGDGHHARSVTVRLRQALEEVPAQLSPMAPMANGARSGRPPRVPLRQWFHLEVEVEASLLVSEASERLGALLRQEMVDLDRLRAIADYYIRAAHQGRSDGAGGLAEELRQGLLRLSRQIAELATSQERAVAEIIGELERAVAQRLTDALAPVIEGRYPALLRRVSERGQAGPGRQRFRGLRRAWEQVSARLRRLRPVGAEAIAELGALFAEGASPADLEHYARLVAAAGTIEERIPLLYRRLFGPAPDAAELLVERPLPSAALASAISRWQQGLSTCALIRGDRGAGKRTIVRRVVPSLEAGGADVIWLRLTSAVDDEASIAAGLGALAGVGSAETFEEIAERLASDERRRVIVVENGERLFKRSLSGSAEAGRFLAAMRRASPRVMWLVMVSQAGAALVDSVIDLSERFDAVIEVGPMSAEELSTMILARHRLSGYALDFAGVRRGPLERLIPALGARSRRDTAALRHLHALSGGNPRQALTFWLAAAQPQADPGRIVIGPLPRLRGSVLTGLSLHELLMLAALVQHGPLRPSLLAEVCERPVAALEASLVRLRGRGLLSSSASDPQARVIAAHLVHPITLELRQRNIV
jgi:Kef-type K+ transport system membrane component KefB